jgi:hypothetical protein
MPKFKNVSPLGALDLPLIGRVVDRGEVIEVTAAQAKHLRGQTDTWKPVGSSNPAGGQTPPDPDPGAEQLAADPQSEE